MPGQGIIRVEGVQRALKAIKKMAVKDAIKIQLGLKRCAELLLAESQKLVPVDTGALKRSGHVVVYGTGFAALSTVIYSDRKAVLVHERTEVRHTPPTQAKFLERPARELKDRFNEIVQREVKVI